MPSIVETRKPVGDSGLTTLSRDHDAPNNLGMVWTWLERSLGRPVFSKLWLDRAPKRAARQAVFPELSLSDRSLSRKTANLCNCGDRLARESKSVKNSGLKRDASLCPAASFFSHQSKRPFFEFASAIEKLWYPIGNNHSSSGMAAILS